MHRTVVAFTEAQVAALRRRSARTGRSMAAVIREAVDRELARDDWDLKKHRAVETARGSSLDLGGDLSARHDDVFVEASQATSSDRDADEG